MEFTDINALLNKLATDITMEMALENGEIANEIIDVINEKSEDIYNFYQPKMYIRRYEFKNRNNIKITNVSATNRNIQVEFRNMTEGTTDREPIDWMIEQNVYNYYPSDSDIPKRPVYEPARQELEGGRLEEAVKKSLERKGWEIV